MMNHPVRGVRWVAPWSASPLWRSGLLAVAAWALLAAITALWPNQVAGFTDWAYTQEFGAAAAWLDGKKKKANGSSADAGMGPTKRITGCTQ